MMSYCYWFICNNISILFYAFRGFGVFTVRADDGSIEKNIPRSRLESLVLVKNDDENFSNTNTNYLDNQISKKKKSPKKLTKRQLSYQKANQVVKDNLPNVIL